MKTLIITLLLKFLTPTNIASIMAKCIANLLRYASKNGGKNWDTTKQVIDQVSNWTSLYNQVYDDEELTKEEEGKIAKAIELNTLVPKIVDLIKK